VSPDEAMRRIDAVLSHVWMVRQFLKHSDEAVDEPELMDVARELYDVMLAVGPTWQAQDADGYLKIIGKKLGKLRRAAAEFEELQPEVSTHTNFLMAVRSLNESVRQVEELAGAVG